jgi:serine/threonine protein phosphatase 1
MNSLQLSFRCGGFLFVHVGIRLGVPVADQDEKDLLWIREDFLGSEAPFGVFVVHDHTPVRTPEKRSNRLNMDTGAFCDPTPHLRHH